MTGWQARNRRLLIVTRTLPVPLGAWTSLTAVFARGIASAYRRAWTGER